MCENLCFSVKNEGWDDRQGNSERKSFLMQQNKDEQLQK